DKVCVMDTADCRVRDQWLANLKNALNGRSVDYLVVQHVEPDHSANIAALMAEYPDMKVVGNAKTLTMLGQFYHIPGLGFNFITVKEGDTLELGSHTLKFFMTPMVHWPEVMMTYEESEKAFFSADAFGKFGALDTDEDWACEARRYYFNIVGKYGAQVQAVLKKASALDIKMILPLHGPMLTENLDYYLNLYNTWSSYQPEEKGIFVACASIHGNTLTAAEKFCNMLEERGAEKVVLADLSREDWAESVEDAFRYDRLVLMAASYDGGVFPVMEEFLMHLRDKTYRSRTIAMVENGSWAPSAARVMKSYVEKFKDITLVEPVVTIKSSLDIESEAKLKELADALTAK
uniref:FprA family A-type flavoprotein n=1 Tax=uncultured Ruminococcus sp. TaxID=165186 RepID=UPI0025E0CD2D